MPRYELDGKFWDIAQNRAVVTTKFGKVGSPGQTRLKTFPSPSHAAAYCNEAIEKKKAEGYAIVDPILNKPVLAAKAGDTRLEAAIEADPYDVDAYSVYADHLQGAGDPRGELIALQLANKQAAAKKLLAKHADYFLGPLAAHQLCYDHSSLRKKGARKAIQIRPEAFTWRYGFIHALRLSHNCYAVDASDPKYDLDGSLADVLAAVLAHPSGRFLTEITFTFNNDPSRSLQDLIDVLAKRAPKTIRKLHFGDYRFAGGGWAGMAGHDTEISWYSVGNLGRLWKAVPGLRHLITQGGAAGHALGGGIQLGTIELPNLVHAEVRTGGLERTNARAIAKAKVPNIEHLEIWYGSPSYGGNATIKDVVPLLARTDLPKLRHLGLRDANFADELPAALIGSRLLPRLAVLDLSLGTLTDDGARVIAEHRDAFAHLERLDVGANYLSPVGLKLLKGVVKKLVTGQQRVDQFGRYPAVGE